MSNKRPGVKIKFKYNLDTGEIEEFIIDDSAPAASEDYHDKVANLIAQKFARNPEITDAGPIRHTQGQTNISKQIKTDKSAEKSQDFVNSLQP